LERRVGGVHHHLGHQFDHSLVVAQPAKVVAGMLLDQIAELALGLGVQHVEARRRHDGAAGLVLQQQGANLRPVAVHQRDAVPRRRQHCNLAGRLIEQPPGVLAATARVQRVAAQGNDQ